jgi:hypothetical protein
MQIRRRFSTVALAVLTMVLAFGATSAYAQEDSEEGFGIGVKIGPLWSNLDLDNDVTPSDQAAGFLGGIWFGGNRSGTIGVMGEVNYGRRKSHLGGQDFKQDFVNVNAFLRGNFGSDSREGVAGYVIAGPGIDINLTTELDDVDIKDEVEDFTVDLVLGAGVEITRFIVELRYIRGLKNINKEFDQTTDIKTEAIALLFGVRFN